MYKIVRSFSLLMISFMLAGCSYLPEPSALMSCLCFDFKPLTQTTITIETTKTTNYGAPFYVVVKHTNFPDFLAADYDKMAALLVSPPEEEENLTIVCVVPGLDSTVKIQTPEDEAIAVYCLFTNPGEAWKHIFELNGSNQKITIALGQNEITSVVSKNK